MAKYRKKPVVIEARQFNYDSDDGEIIKWIGWPNYFYRRENYSDVLYIKTLEGDMRVEKGDYIIKGVKGEFYPCKPDIFEQTYEKVDD